MTVSCIITSYEQKQYLRQAIESVLAQTRPVDEIIVADDASEDGSQDLIRALAADYRRIRPILRETNLGIATNRDLAIRSAGSVFITTLDGDDFYYPTKVELEMELLSAEPKAIAFSGINLVDPSGTVFKSEELSAFPGALLAERMAYVAGRVGTLPRDMLIPKDLYLNAGGFRHELPVYEDWDLKIRLAAQASSWVHSASIGVAYRQTGQGLSNLSRQEHKRAIGQVLNLNKQLLHTTLGPEGFQKACWTAPPKLTPWIGRWALNHLPQYARERLREIRGGK